MLSYDPYGPEQIFPWKTIRKKFSYEGHMGRGDRARKKRRALLEIRTAQRVLIPPKKNEHEKKWSYDKMLID